MRKVWIDTDTASDDAVAIMMALREPSVEVVGISTVAGNVPLDKVVRNCLISVERAETYAPPVYVGLAKPLMRDAQTAEICHGQDGLSDIGYADPQITVQPQHAVDALLDAAEKYPGELELITLGPLTNIAAAFYKQPESFKKIKEITIMGGQLHLPGNWTITSEFNIVSDPEAAETVMNSGVRVIIAPFEICCGDVLFTPQDREEIRLASPAGEFAMDCNKVLVEFGYRLGLNGSLGLADPAAMGIFLWPETAAETTEAYICVETQGVYCCGQILYDYLGHLGRKPNGAVCSKMDAKLYKDKVKALFA